MKNRLIIIVIVFCTVMLLDLVASIESTVRQEEFARMGTGNEAYSTSRQEEVERIQNVDDAYFTERQEEVERLGYINDASSTGAAERAARN